jgi:hypothetical protein
MFGAAVVETSEWSLAGREGNVFRYPRSSRGNLSLQTSRVPTSLQKRCVPGHAAEIKEHKAGTRPAIEVRVPSRDLYVMFVKSSTCRADEPGKK